MLRVFHPLFTTLLLISLLIFFIFLVYEFLSSDSEVRTRWVHYLLLPFIFFVFTFYIFSTFSLWHTFKKVTVEYNGKKWSYLIDENTPLWILKQKAKEKYYGHNLFINTSKPEKREYIAYIGMDKVEYDENLLNYLGINLHIEKKPGILPKLLLILSFILLWSTILCKVHRELFLLKSTLVILLSFYMVVISYDVFLFKVSFLRTILYLGPIFFYIIALALAPLAREYMEYKLTFKPPEAGWSFFHTLLASLVSLLFLSLVFQKVHILPFGINAFIKRLYQPSVLEIFLIAAGIYWYYGVEKNIGLQFIIFLISLVVGVGALFIARDFGVLYGFFWPFLFQFILELYSLRFYNKGKGIIPFFIFIILILSLFTTRHLFREILETPLLRKFIPSVPYRRIAILTAPFSAPQFEQLAFYNYLIVDGLYFGKGFFAMVPMTAKLPFLKYMHSDHPYAILAYCGGVPLLSVFYLYKFFFYALVAYLIYEQKPFERFRRLSLFLYPILLTFLIFDLLSILGTFRIVTFTGVPTILLSYAFSLTLFFLLTISPVFTLKENQNA